jgi:acetyl esterase/lipase
MQITWKVLRVVACVGLLPSGPAAAQRRQPWASLKETASKIETYKKTPQGGLKMYIHLPPGWKAEDKRPAIVFFFGGGWTGGSVRQFLRQADYLAGRGMVAARADYRVKSRHKVTPDKCVEDARSAVRWIRARAARLGVDPDRIVASGGSAGGHLAACTAVTDGPEDKDEDKSVSSRANAMVLFNPALNFTSMERLMSRLGGDEKLARQISPTLHLKKDSPPALLLFGSKDFLLAQCKEWMAKAKKIGHKSELYLAEGPGHGFFNRSPWYERTLYRADEFLASLGYVKGKPTIELPKSEPPKARPDRGTDRRRRDR